MQADAIRGTHDASNNMGDLHEVVIDNIGKVVRRESVRLDEDEIALILVLLVMPVDGISERRTPLAAEPDHVALATGSTTCRLVGRDAAASTGVVD